MKRMEQERGSKEAMMTGGAREGSAGGEQVGYGREERGGKKDGRDQNT